MDATNNESKPDLHIPKDFFKQFKDKKQFQSFFNELFKTGVEQMLQAELDAHLGYDKHSKAGYNSGNSRNGSYRKTVKTESLGDMALSIPRDRASTFEPALIPKGGRSMSEELEANILSLYGRGMTTSDIAEHVQAMYGVEISASTISTVTDQITEHISAWQKRTLEPVYFAVWMDGIRFSIRQEGRYINKCIYLVIGLGNNGLKEVLGMWVAETESASFWLKVLTDLKARGVEDVLIACTDNLTGFTQAIKGVFPKTITQLCIVHQIRNSCKFVVYKDRKAFCADLKAIYGAVGRDQAEEALVKLEQNWGGKYGIGVHSWQQNWADLSAFFDFPIEIRRIIYTTNTIEGLNRGIRKYTKTKIQYSHDEAAKKVVYLAIKNIEKAWTKPIQNWGLIMHQFMTIFGERCRLS